MITGLGVDSIWIIIGVSVDSCVYLCRIGDLFLGLSFLFGLLAYVTKGSNDQQLSGSIGCLLMGFWGWCP